MGRPGSFVGEWTRTHGTAGWAANPPATRPLGTGGRTVRCPRTCALVPKSLRRPRLVRVEVVPGVATPSRGVASGSSPSPGRTRPGADALGRSLSILGPSERLPSAKRSRKSGAPSCPASDASVRTRMPRLGPRRSAPAWKRERSTTRPTPGKDSGRFPWKKRPHRELIFLGG